ncbi:DDE-domain-containing partial [Lentinula edodes]|uniref:DDE-domain-containing partial n=1 Tax=Lentinula edodes TaxID=5353 RepID=A0A1Q3ER65_LENED|nr:DDE-domain-containing partial [Lentinula edodes]
MSNALDDPDMPELVSSDSDDEGVEGATPPQSKEEAIQSAMQAIESSNGELSVRKAAKAYGVHPATLQRRVHGGKSRSKAHAHQQNLSPAQEDLLVEWIKVQGQRGVPLLLPMVSAYASDIAGKPMGDNWICRFRTRHPDLALKFTTSLEESRACSLTLAAVSTSYDVLADTVAQYEIPPENIYNMDEKGVQLGIGQRTAVLVDRNQKSFVPTGQPSTPHKCKYFDLTQWLD